MRVSIAMTTFNGAKYIQEQIDSLVSQTLLPFELVICDDGSTDATVDILERVSAKLPFKVRIYQNEERLNFTGNFLKAASLCIGDVVAFCDQDDIWEPRKIEVCLPMLSVGNSDLVIHEGRVVDSNGRVTDLKIPDFSGDMMQISKPPFDGISKGFAMVMRREVVNDVLACWDWDEYIKFKGVYGSPLGHDLFIYAWCVNRKKISFIQEELVRYRIHEANVTASSEITKSRQAKLVAFFGKMAFDKDMYSLPSRKWAAEVDYINDYICRCSSENYPGLIQLAEWLERKSKLWLSRSSIYDKESSRKERIKNCSELLLAGGYVSNQEPHLGIKSLIKDLFVALIG